MVKIIKGDLFASKAQTLVNTVNCVGVMGKGIALEFKKRFPEMYIDYEKRCRLGLVKLGEPYLFPSLIPPWILNFPTKDHWRSVSRLSDIIKGLDYLLEHYQEWGITSLAVPPLGCGQGRLEWKVVGPTLYRYFQKMEIPVELYAPYGTPDDQLQSSFLSGNATAAGEGEPIRKINSSWVALVEILARIEREPYHWPVGRTIFQKIAYFSTHCGLPTGLRYIRGSYGPFASELKPLVTKLVNNGLLVEESKGRMFVLHPGRTFKDAAHLFRDEIDQWEEIIDDVTDLFLRLNTEQAELAATVHFAAETMEKNGHPPTEMDVFHEVKQWKKLRRPPLVDENVAETIRNLNAMDWLKLNVSEELPLPEDCK